MGSVLKGSEYVVCFVNLYELRVALVLNIEHILNIQTNLCMSEKQSYGFKQNLEH